MSYFTPIECPGMVPYTTFDEYKKKYEHIFKLTQNEFGVVTVKWHKNGGGANWDYPYHRGIHQLCSDLGQDPTVSCVIMGGTDDVWFSIGAPSISEHDVDAGKLLLEHNWYDGCNMIEGIVNDLEVPTIGILNGKGNVAHSEIALFCDITLIADDTNIWDPHTIGGFLPGDGIQIALRECMGTKRSSYAMLTNEVIPAQTALEYGMVNEVLPREELYTRALEIANKIAQQDRQMMRTMTHITRRNYKKAIAEELRTTFAMEMWGSIQHKKDHAEAFAAINDSKK